MTNLRPTTIADFDHHGVMWQCFTRPDGSYVWRSRCGRYSVWREGASWLAARGDRAGTIRHKSITAAMWAAQSERRAVA